MSDVPVTAADVDHDFDANASPPPGSDRHGLVADPNAADPGHLAENDEWAEIVARAEGKS